MRYRLEMTQAENWESNSSLVVAEGVRIDGGMQFTYNFDGAKYRLVITKNNITHSREGEVSIEMNFKRGKTTVVTFSYGANKGSFSIFTDYLSVQFDGGKVVAECAYFNPSGGEIRSIAVVATPL